MSPTDESADEADATTDLKAAMTDGDTAMTDGGTDETMTDGGTVDSPFEVVSEYEETRMDRYSKYYDAYVRAPFAIIWRDWRARIGFSIVLFYLLMGTVGTSIVEPAGTLDGDSFIQPFNSQYTIQPWGIPEFSLGFWTYTGIWEFPLGTDRMGRDLFAQTVHATPSILKMITAGALFAVGTGTVIGAVAGYRGGWTDTVLSSITDVFINLPGFPLVMVLALLLDVQNPYLIGILLSVAAWGGVARAIRSQVLTLRQENFVESGRAMGIPRRRIVFKDIVPHLMPYVVINMTNTARRVIFEAAALYYLGVLPFRDLNWGVTLNLAQSGGAYYRPDALHWFLVPMFAIIGISIGLILLGQSLDRVFNPRVRARHEKTTVDEEADMGGDEPSTGDMITGK